MDDITTRHNPSDPDDLTENPRVAYEHGDADVFTISKYGIGLAFGVLIAASAMWGLFAWFQAQDRAEVNNVPKSVLDARPKLPPSPRLQATPKLDLREFRAAEDRMLGSYGWVDPARQIVRIPIEQAMAAVVKKGLPSKPVQTGEGLDQDGYRLLPEYSSSGRTSEKVAQ
jgi:hypothetical protein